MLRIHGLFGTGTIELFKRVFWLFGNSREIDLHDKSSKYGISRDVSDFITFWLLWIILIQLTADARR
jgi:hypothetical protein